MSRPQPPPPPGGDGPGFLEGLLPLPSIDLDHILSKRIVMNPPQAFLDTSALSNPPTAPFDQMDGPVVFGQNGQAAIITHDDPPSAPAQAQDQDQSNGAAKSPSDGDTSASTGDNFPVDHTRTAAQPNGDEAGQESTAASDSDPSPQPAQSTTATSVPTSTLDVATSGSVSATSDIATSTSPSDTPSTSSWTSSISSSSSYSTSSYHSSQSQSASVSASASSSSATADTTPKPFTHSPLFIFLLVLSGLVVLCVLATSLSWAFRRSNSSPRSKRGCLPFCGRRRRGADDDDGLTDVVDSFHYGSGRRNSGDTLGGMSVHGLGFGPTLGVSPGEHGYGYGYGFTEAGYDHRADTTAGLAGVGMGAGGIDLIDEKDSQGILPDLLPNQLHLEDPAGNMGRVTNPLNLARSGGGPEAAGDDARSVMTGTGKYTNTGPLEIRNFSPGDFDKESSIFNWAQAQRAVGGGVEGHPMNGIDEGMQTRFDALSRASSTRLSVPYLQPPDARDYLAPTPTCSPDHPRPQPLQSTSGTKATYANRASGPETEGSSSLTCEDVPSRAGTWASNLRNTLYAAIQGVRGPSSSADLDLEADRQDHLRAARNLDALDHYTRAVSPSRGTSRRSSQRSAQSALSARSGSSFRTRMGADLQAGGQRLGTGEGSDDGKAIAIGSHFLTPSLTGSTQSTSTSNFDPASRSRGDLTRTFPLKQAGRLGGFDGLTYTGGGGAGDRYKQHYSKTWSRSSASSISSASVGRVRSGSGSLAGDENSAGEGGLR